MHRTNAFLSFVFVLLGSFAFSQDRTSTTTEIEQVFLQYNLVDIQTLSPDIQVDLKYASKDNFVNLNLYGDLNKAYLQKETCKKLAYAQQLLKNKRSDYSLIIFDATRPQSIQQMLWDNIDVPQKHKAKYVAHPQKGSLHNYGAAVDVSIVDKNGNLLDMGTGFDCFDKLAYPYFEKRFLKSGELTLEQYNNRLLLRNIMKKAGFMGITSEWWHFNACYLKEAKEQYPMVVSHQINNLKNNDLEKETTQELVFRVQIYISRKEQPISWFRLKNQADFYYRHNKMYKYTSGSFKTYKEANKHRKKMQNIGFKTSFPVAFYQGKRININKAISIESKKES